MGLTEVHHWGTRPSVLRPPGWQGQPKFSRRASWLTQALTQM